MATVEERIDALSRKLDLVLENQKQQAVKYENYSAFFRKKLNDSFDALTNAVTSQTVMLTERIDGLAKLIVTRTDAAAKQPDDPVQADVLRRLAELSQAVQESSAVQTELMSHHASLLGKSVADGFRQLGAVQDADLKLHQDASETISRKVSASFEHLYEMLLDNADLVRAAADPAFAAQKAAELIPPDAPADSDSGE